MSSTLVSFLSIDIIVSITGLLCRMQDRKEMERHKAAAKQSIVRPRTQLFLTFSPFPVWASCARARYNTLSQYPF